MWPSTVPSCVLNAWIIIVLYLQWPKINSETLLSPTTSGGPLAVQFSMFVPFPLPASAPAVAIMMEVGVSKVVDSLLSAEVCKHEPAPHSTLHTFTSTTFRARGTDPPYTCGAH